MKHQLTERYLDKVELPADQPQMIVWDEEVPGFVSVRWTAPAPRRAPS